VLIIGTMTLNRTRATGAFYCPYCRDKSSFRLRAGRPFLTLYFIPVIPIGGATVRVHCDRCKQEFEDGVHKLTEEEIEANFAVKFAADLISIASLAASEAEVTQPRAIDRALQAIREQGKVDVDQTGFESVLEQAKKDRGGLLLFLRVHGNGWNQDERSRIAQTVFVIASINNPMTEKSLESLKRIPPLLRMSEDQFRELIADTLL
jgi:hypothetical protein